MAHNKFLPRVLAAAAAMMLLAGCGSKTTAPDNTNNDQPQQAALSGSVSTNGSTSMEKVIGALGESFMEQHIQADGDAIDAVMGYDDDLTMGAVAAIQEAGLGDQIKVYSLTGQNDAIQAVADGQLQLTVMNRADDIAAETCVAMYEYLTTGSTEYYHYTNLTFITPDNVNDYIGKGEF